MQKFLRDRKQKCRNDLLRTALLLTGFIFFVFSHFPLYAATVFVTNTNDNGAGSFRQALIDTHATNADTIAFNAGGTITLQSNLPPVQRSMTLNLGANNIIINGQNSYQALSIFNGPFVQTGTGTLTLEMVASRGGAGGAGLMGGGGGLGAGGGIFIAPGMAATLTNVIATNNVAVGGSGGAPSNSGGVGGGSGGGGLLGGAGAQTVGWPIGGGGGGIGGNGGEQDSSGQNGIATAPGTAAGGTSSSNEVGGQFGGGGGGGSTSNNQQGAGGGGINGGNANGANGGNGGFGGGGGGGREMGGSGGFGGGSGGGSIGGPSGFGGGAGGNNGSVGGGFGGGAGGSLGDTSGGGGGGGAGLGGALFIGQNGSATMISTVNTNFTNNTVQGGSGGVGSGRPPGTVGSASGQDIFLNSSTVTFNEGLNATRTLNGTISDNGAAAGTGGFLIKTGAGTLVLNALNDYHGRTTISAGTISISNNLNLGSTVAPIVFEAPGTGALLLTANLASARSVTLNSDGTINTGANITGTFTGNFTGNGGFTKAGAGTVLVSGNNTYTGATNVIAGILQAGSNTAFGNHSATMVSAGATLAFNNFNATIGSLTGAVGSFAALGTATLTTGGSGMSTTFAGVISGAGGLTKAGGGTFTVSGANTYTGATTVNAGILQAGMTTNAGNTAGAFGVNSAVTVSAGATLAFNNFNATIGSLTGAGGSFATLGTGTLTTGGSGTSTTFAGVISGAGGLTKAGGGTFTVSGANTYTGATTVNAGILQAGMATNVGNTAGAFGVNSAVTVSTGATLAFNNFNATIGSLTGVGGSFATLGTGTLTTGGSGTSTTFAGVISGAGGLTKAGGGTFTVSGANTYTGATTVNAGILQAGMATNVGNTAGAFGVNSAVTVNAGATLALNNFNATMGSLTGAGGSFATLGTATLTTGGSGTSTTFAGVISGAGGLTKAGGGTFTVSGANTYTGATTVNAGILQAGMATNVGNTAGAFGVNSAVTVSTGATLALNNFNATMGSLTGAGGSFATLGTGTLTTGGSGTSTTFAGVISGAGGLTKAGGGTFTVSGANTYTGATTVNAGILQAGMATNVGNTAGAFGVNSAVTVSTGATLVLNNFNATIGSLTGAGGSFATLGTGTLTTGGSGTSTTFAGVISGAGGLTKAGGGTFTVSGANTYTGATTVNAGILQSGIGTNAGNTAGAFGVNSAVTVGAGATLALNNFNATIGSLAGILGSVITLGEAAGGTLTTGGNNTSTTFSGAISGMGVSAGLTKVGTGTFTLAGANTYTGATTVNAGILQAGMATNAGNTAGAFGVNSAVTVSAGATLALNNFNATIGSLTGTGDSFAMLGTGTLTTGGDGRSTIFAGVISGAGGSLTKIGAGNFILSRANTYAGNTNLNAGTLTVNNNLALGSSFLNLNGGALQTMVPGLILANNFFAHGGSIGGSANLIFNNGIGTLNATLPINNTAITRFNGVLSGMGGLTVNTGTTILAAANTYSGDTVINTGILQSLPAANNTFSSNSSVMIDPSGTLVLNSTTQTVKDLSGAGVVSLGAGRLNTGAQNTNTTYAGVMTGVGGRLVKNGTGTFTLTGLNNYSGGTLVNGGVLQGTTASLQGDITNHAQVTFNQGFNGTYTGNMSGTGAVNIQGGGVTFIGNHTYSGGTNINSGTLALGAANALPPAGNIAIHNSAVLSIGALTLTTTGNYTQGGNAGFATTLIDQGNYGKLILNGSATIADGAFIYVTSDVNVNGNDLYDIITANSAPSANVNLLRIIPVNGPFKYRAFIVGNALRLQVLQEDYLSSLTNVDANATAIALTLEDIQFDLPLSSDFFSAIQALDQLPPEQVLTAIQSLEPDMSTGPHMTTRGIAEMAFQEINNRLDYLRDRRYASDYGMRSVSHQLKRGYQAGDPWHSAANAQNDGDINGSVGPFIIGNTIKQITKGYQFGFNAQTQGVGYIADVAVADNTCLQLDHGRFGVGATYTSSRVRSRNPNGGKTNIMSPQLLAYGYAEKNFLFSDMAIGISRNWYQEERRMHFGSISRCASAKYTGLQYGGRARLGYCLARDLFETTPMAILQYTRLNLNTYTEKGADSLSLIVQDQKFSSMRGGLGVRIAYTVNKSQFLPELRVFYFRDLNQPKIDLSAQFTGGGAAFKQHTPILSRNSLVFGLGFTTHLNTSLIKDFYFSMNFDGERKENFKDYSARANLWWIFD